MSTEFSKTLMYDDWDGNTLSAEFVITIRHMPKENYNIFLKQIEELTEKYNSHHNRKSAKN